MPPRKKAATKRASRVRKADQTFADPAALRAIEDRQPDQIADYDKRRLFKPKAESASD